MRAALLLTFALAGCGNDGPPTGKVTRGDKTWRMGERIQVAVGEHESFRHRYRFRAEKRQAVSIQAETGGMMLEISIYEPGERPRWKRGPNAEVRDRFTALESGLYELEIFGDGLTYGNSYRLTIGP